VLLVLCVKLWGFECRGSRVLNEEALGYTPFAWHAVLTPNNQGSTKVRHVNHKKRWELPPPAEPVTDDYLSSVTIGERQPLDDTIRLVPYDNRWPLMFSLAAHKIRSVLSGQALLIEHVGSTAVPGLSAKPIIDMVLVVADSSDEHAYVPLLERQGFILRTREPEWFRHRFLILELERTAFQLHVFSADCEEVDRMLAFRDWLRTHDDDRRKYEEGKRELTARTWRHVQNYADAKSEIIREILTRAREDLVSDTVLRA
jgi:GrpB-like predicted nucleotidyltransferase (UPF0157 family)